MGLFDTVLAKIKCPTCSTEGVRDVQFKHEGNLLEVYEVGDFACDAPAGQPLLRGGFVCKACSAKGGGASEDWVECWVHIDRGFITAVTVDPPERPEPAAWWMFERAGRDAREYRASLRAVDATVRKRRRTLAEGDPGRDRGWAGLGRVESEAELMKSLEGIVQHAEERAWPGGPSGARAGRTAVGEDASEDA